MIYNKTPTIQEAPHGGNWYPCSRRPLAKSKLLIGNTSRHALIHASSLIETTLFSKDTAHYAVLRAILSNGRHIGARIAVELGLDENRNHLLIATRVAPNSASWQADRQVGCWLALTKALLARLHT